MDIAESLRTLKTVFGPKSERAAIVAECERRFSPCNRDWLDIGIGDGQSTNAMITSLKERGRLFSVLGIDPQLDPERSSATMVAIGIDEFQPPTNFDVINIRHSAYYSTTPVETIGRYFNALSTDGFIALTHSSRACFSYQLHLFLAQIASDPSPSPAIEDIFHDLSRSDHKYCMILNLFDDFVDTRALSASAELKKAAFKIAQRRISFDHTSDQEKIAIIDKFLASSPSPIRSTGLLLLSNQQPSDYIARGISAANNSS